VATAVASVLRVGSFIANFGFPHGDVHLDAATSESLGRGRGFWTPWEEGACFRPDELTPNPQLFGHPVDQHGPLWPLFGAPFTWLTGGDGVLALQIVSMIFGIATIPVAALLFGKVSARAGCFAAWACALAIPLCDYSGNGSLYMAEVFGILALPLVAGELDSPRRSIGAGIWLGLLFLLNYQCAVLVPAFVAAVFVVMGLRGVKPLALAGIGCVAAVFPWLVRNAMVFGDPLYTTNPQYIVHHLRLVGIDLKGERPMLTGTATCGQLWAGAQHWFPTNFAYWATTIHLALPILPLFAPAGFARMLGLRAGDRRSLSGVLVLSCFVALLVISSLWPSPKARYVVPLVGLVAGAAMVELVEGARFLPAILVSLGTVLLGWWLDAPNHMGFPWREGRFLLPTLLIPFLAISSLMRAALPTIALALLVVHGSFRVFLSVDRAAAARLLFSNPDAVRSFGPPSPTFYDVLAGPIEEGYDKATEVELRRIAGRLRDFGIQRAIAPPELYTFWRGRLVTLPPFANRFDLGVLPTTRDVFAADGLVVPLRLTEDPNTRNAIYAWLSKLKATSIFGTEDGAAFYVAFQIPFE
jgi:hypothetical protein